MVQSKPEAVEFCHLNDRMQLIPSETMVSTRKTVVDHFEAIYLRENCAKKAFSKPEDVKELLNDPDFEACIKYMANLSFQKNKIMLIRHGFGYDDMLNIIRTLALQFVNHKFEGKTKRDTYYVLMHFINQKLDTFYIFLNRKFRISESYIDISLSIIPNRSLPTVNAMEYAEEEAGTLDETPAVRSAKLTTMREKLQSNLPEYSAKLAEMATSKVIEFKIRKKARTMCKKYGIDYMAWAKEQIKTRNLSEADFVLG